jgi:ribosomal protein S18 acetylase RimI-like enzyme
MDSLIHSRSNLRLLPVSVEIIPIRHDHIEAFHRALDRVARERDYLAMTEAPPLTETRAFVEGNIAKGYPQFVVLVDDVLVGWGDIIPNSRPLYAHGGVLGLGIVAEFRGLGLGGALISKLLLSAQAMGLKRVQLTVRSDNQRAIKLYERLGFQHEGEMRMAIHIDGIYKNSLMMAISDLDVWQAPAATT